MTAEQATYIQRVMKANHKAFFVCAKESYFMHKRVLLQMYLSVIFFVFVRICRNANILKITKACLKNNRRNSKCKLVLRDVEGELKSVNPFFLNAT